MLDPKTSLPRTKGPSHLQRDVISRIGSGYSHESIMCIKPVDGSLNISCWPGGKSGWRPGRFS